MLGIKPSSSQQKRGFVPPLLPFHIPAVICGIGDPEQSPWQGGGCRLVQCSPDTH